MDTITVSDQAMLEEALQPVADLVLELQPEDLLDDITFETRLKEIREAFWSGWSEIGATVLKEQMEDELIRLRDMARNFNAETE